MISEGSWSLWLGFWNVCCNLRNCQHASCMRRFSSLVSSEKRSTADNLLPCRFFASGLYRRIVCHLGDDAPCTSLRTAFNAAMTTRFHFPPLVLLPFRCGGLCAALGITIQAFTCGLASNKSSFQRQKSQINSESENLSWRELKQLPSNTGFL